MAAARALLRPRVANVCDDKFESLLQDTLYAKQLKPGLDPQDIEAFGPHLERDPSQYYKSDFSAVAGMESISPDIHLRTRPGINWS